jgi:hypothetical protein
MSRALQREDDAVKSGAVRHWSRVHRRIRRRYVIDVDVVARCHGVQVAVRKHDTFGHARRAGRVKDPGEVDRIARLQRMRLAAKEIVVRRSCGINTDLKLIQNAWLD